MNDLKVLSDEFVNISRNIKTIDFITLTIDDLRSNPKWGEWSRKRGVYYFQKEDDVVYVGRALRSLGSRVQSQINSFGDPKWDHIINNKDIIVGVICLDDDLWYLASALEIYFIDKLQPEFNKRLQ